MILLSSCGPARNTPIEITTVPSERPPLVLPPVDVLTMRPVEWTVVTQDNIEEVFAERAANGQSLVLFALTADGYENLSLNLSDVRQLVQQQQTIIVAYRNYVNNIE